MEDLNNKIKPIVQTEIYRNLFSKAEYTLFPSIQGAFKIYHILCHKTSVKNVTKCKVCAINTKEFDYKSKAKTYLENLKMFVKVTM